MGKKGATNKVTVKMVVKFASKDDCTKVAADKTFMKNFKEKFCALMGSKNLDLCSVTMTCQSRRRRLMGERKLSDGSADVTGTQTGLTADEATTMTNNADLKDTGKLAKSV